MIKILLLEDDTVLLETLAEELEDEGYYVDRAKHGGIVYDFTFSTKYDLYIFDVNVPYVDGFTLLEELRKSGDETPLIFLTSKNQEKDKDAGFESGCDDYLCKPFSISELKHRIKAILKRTLPPEQTSYKDVVIDLEQKYLQIASKTVETEYKTLQLLHLFVNNPDKIISMDEIIEEIYAPHQPSLTVIRVHISKINALFEEKRVLNIRGLGYRYETP